MLIFKNELIVFLKIFSILVYIPRIPLKRIIHVKDDDDDEELILNIPQITLNMAQATKQMSVQKDAQPKILLKRVRLEQYNDQ
jgi:hypothetical protein